MSEENVQYAGVENLDAMEHADNYNRHLVRLMTAQFPPGASLLDFGAGHGTMARRMRAEGFRVDCLEVDARYRMLLAGEGFAAHDSPAGLADSSLDGVYLVNVLEHIEHDVDALRSLREKIKPGGRIFVYVPAFQVLYSSMDRAIGHYRRYSRDQLVQTLRAAGFAVGPSHYHDSVGFLAALVYKVIGDRSGRIKPGQVTFYDRAIFPLSRALDSIFGGLIGKNVSAVGTRE